MTNRKVMEKLAQNGAKRPKQTIFIADRQLSSATLAAASYHVLYNGRVRSVNLVPD